MSGYHEFRYTRPPQVTDWLPAAGLSVLACFLTAVALITAMDPTQRTGNFVDDYVMWPLAFAAWVVALYVARFDWRRLQAFRAGEPAIRVDDGSITLPGLAGKPVELGWGEVDAISLGRRKGGSELLIRAGRLSGSVPLDNLDVEPDGVWQVVNGCAKRAGH